MQVADLDFSPFPKGGQGDFDAGRLRCKRRISLNLFLVEGGYDTFEGP